MSTDIEIDNKCMNKYISNDSNIHKKKDIERERYRLLCFRV